MGETDLATWLLAQVQADADVINAAVRRTNAWSRLDVPWLKVKRTQPELRKADETLLAVWDPDRLLAECDTKRRIIETYQGAVFTQECHPEYEGNNGYVQALCDVLRLMAVVYKDRPGYVAEGAPDGRGAR